jgi:hypothetical protein
MKKVIMISLAVTIATAATFAQEKKQPPAPAAPKAQPAPQKKTPEERAEQITRHMTKTLALNPDQQTKIKELIIKREKEREAIQANMKAKREEMEKQRDEDFQKILNSEQFEKFKRNNEEMKKKRIEKRMEKRMPPDMEGPPAPPMEEKK